MPLRILISSPANGSGKTSLLVQLLRQIPGRFAAAKFITIQSEGGRFCPSHETECACRRLQGNWGLITDSEVLAQTGTDTGRMVEAGALSTFWGIARPGWHEELWREFETRHLGSLGDLLIEGGRIEKQLEPDRILFVLDPCVPRERWKKSTLQRLDRADLVIVNRRVGNEEEDESQVDLAHSMGSERVVETDLDRPLSEELVDRLVPQ